MISTHDRALQLDSEPAPSPRTAGDAAAPQAPSLATALSGAFARLDLPARVRVLRHLLLPVGPLALAALGGGVFAKYARAARWSGMPLSPDEVARVTPGQVADIVRYVEQSDPHILERVLRELALDATTMAALAGSFDGIVIQRAARGTAARTPALPRRYLVVREIKRCGRSKQPRKTAATRTHVLQHDAGVPAVARTIHLNVSVLLEKRSHT